MSYTTKNHPPIRCNAHEDGRSCGHTDELVGRPAAVIRNGETWQGRIEWVGRWTSDREVAAVRLLTSPTEGRHFAMDHRTTLVVS